MNRMKNLKLTYYNKKTILSENIGFLRGMLNISKSGLWISVAYIGFLVSFDFIARQLAFVFCNSTNSFLIRLLIYSIK